MNDAPRRLAKCTFPDFFLLLKFIYSEKATKFWEISTLLLSYAVPVKSKVEILQNFVAFSEYMNFIAADEDLNMEVIEEKEEEILGKVSKLIGN